MRDVIQSAILFQTTAVTTHHRQSCFYPLAVSQLNCLYVSTYKQVFLIHSSFQSHLFDKTSGGGWSAHIMPAANILNPIKSVHSYSYKVFFKRRGKKITIILYSAVQAYLCIQVLPCLIKLRPFFLFSS